MKSRSSKAKRPAERRPARRRARTASSCWPDWLAAEVIADKVVWEVSLFLRVKVPRDRYGDALKDRAYRCFRGDKQFRGLMLGPSCREHLASFMRHWMSGLLHRERPDLWVCLPTSFDVGHTLPDGRHPRVNRRNGYPIPKGLRWNPARLLPVPRVAA